jgi:hypothetical protein
MGNKAIQIIIWMTIEDHFKIGVQDKDANLIQTSSQSNVDIYII